MTEKKLPAPFVMSHDALRDWLAGAEAGQSLAYARAAFLPKGNAGAEYVRRLIDQGLVIAWQEREGEDRFRYMVRRTGKSAGKSAGKVAA